MVPRRGLEPPRPYGHQHLKLARLPIPPSGHVIGKARQIESHGADVNRFVRFNAVARHAVTSVCAEV